MNKPGYIYIIKSLNLFKIGKSSGLNRIKSYKTYNPHKLETIINIRVKNYHHVEKILHNIYKKKRISGEWFKLSNNDIKSIINFIYNKSTSPLDKISVKIQYD
jgi:hypothetical protein